jgi:hypothetical protein
VPAAFPRVTLFLKNLVDFAYFLMTLIKKKKIINPTSYIFYISKLQSKLIMQAGLIRSMKLLHILTANSNLLLFYNGKIIFEGAF